MARLAGCSPAFAAASHPLRPLLPSAQTERAANAAQACVRPSVLGKVLQDLESLGLALFRMELRGEEVVPPHGGTERAGVVALDRYERAVLGHAVVGMDEVEDRAVGSSRQVRRGPQEAATIPAHVRNLELARQVETDHLPAEDAEPFVLAHFVAHVEQ